MPELPDVEVFRRYFNRTSLNKKIIRVEITEKNMLGNVSANKLVHALKGNKFTDTMRHGKYMFAKVKSNWLVLHYGMTGFLKYYKNEDQKPEHVKLIVTFSNGYSLAYDCMRKLGVIDLIGNLEKFIEDNEFGKDPLSDDFKFEDFKELVQNGRGSLKSFFMNQKHIAGLGNVYVDELLFHTNLYPKTKLDHVDDKTVKKLYNNMNKILEKAINVGAERKKLPKTYLIGHREEGASCPRCSGKIKQIKISGRSTYFCNKHQKDN